MEGDNVSPGELQGKYTGALKRINSKAGSGQDDRHRPIYQRNSRMTEQQAVEEAAKALTALWKVRRSEKA